MAGARNYDELDAWKLSDAVRVRIYEICKSPRFRSHLRLREQLTDAADSACSNIAEGFGRYYPKEFARFLKISRGSLAEIADRLRSAVLAGIVKETDVDDIVALTHRARGACTRLIKYLEGADPPGRA
ncbi:MAG TPA: four helix bundle protein [Vicinamibacterales bacterium]|nr:four helix bundle protein [Vicinamibacterales bacterium]